jgi:tetratricopeptide (TPR) repeat protein
VSREIHRSAAVALLASVVACARLSNELTYNRAIDDAWDAQQCGDIQGAKVEWWRAYEAADRAKMGPPYTSTSLYNYGRMAGYLCQYDEAREALQKALALDEQALPLDESKLGKSLFELARLDYSHENWDGARGWYDRGIPLLRKLGYDRSDPVAMANELDRYALVLEKTGDAARGAATSGEAAHLRAVHPGASARFVAQLYPAKCDYT